VDRDRLRRKIGVRSRALAIEGDRKTVILVSLLSKPLFDLRLYYSIAHSRPIPLFYCSRGRGRMGHSLFRMEGRTKFSFRREFSLTAYLRVFPKSSATFRSETALRVLKTRFWSFRGA